MPNLNLIDEIVIASPLRTPIGRFGGKLAGFSAAQLGGLVAKEVLRRNSRTSENLDAVVFGHARQAGGGPNTARQIVRLCGMPDAVPAFTVNQACASGLRAVISAAQMIRDGEGRVILAGGTESMSNTPYLLPKARWGYRAGHGEVEDAMYRDGFLCPLCGLLMGETAEKLVAQEKISRKDQDLYALESQKKWAKAQERNRWATEIVPIEVKTKTGTERVDHDEHPRPETTLADLERLKPVFSDHGTVHPGNASGITDGAAACIVTSKTDADRFGLQPAVRLVDYATVGVDPSIMGIGPIPAVKALLKKTGLQLNEIDLVELNEAFAGQVLACTRNLGLDLAKVNVSGGAIALGHPIGCTGARILTTLIHDLADRKARRGIATLCVSGGMGVAVLVEAM